MKNTITMMLVALFIVLGIALCSCSKKEEIPYTTGDTEPEEIADPTKNEKPDHPEFEADKNCEVEVDASITRQYRAQNGMKPDCYLTRAQIESISELTLWDEAVVSLKGIENFKNLNRIVIEKGYLSDISELADMTSLEQIDIAWCYVEEIPDFSKLVNLRELRICGCMIKDISPVNKIPNLENLSLSTNRINEIKCLKDNMTIQDIDISGNAIIDYSSVADCDRIVNALNNYPGFKFEDAVKLENKVKDILSEIIRDDMTELEKELAIYEYIIDNTTYNENMFSEYTYGYRAIMDHEGVCGNYAESFALMASHAGLDAFVCSSDVHAWDIIKIDGKYYHVDALWDDDRDYFDYFNRSSEYMINVDSHKFEPDKYPECGEDMDVSEYYDEMIRFTGNNSN